MAGLMNTVSRLAGTAGSVSKRRSAGTPAAGGTRGTGMGGPTTRGTSGGMAGGLLSKFLRRR
jgi:hypothetical protein